MTTRSIALPQHSPSALHPGLPVLPDEIVLLVFDKLSIKDTVHCAAVCRSWRSLLRSKACWARIPLQLTLDEQTWNPEDSMLKAPADAIVRNMLSPLPCGLLHTTELHIGLHGDLHTGNRRHAEGHAESALHHIVRSFFESFTTLRLPSLAIESLTLANIDPSRELCAALAPHCKHVKTLHFTYPISMGIDLRYILEACLSLDDIHLGWPSTWRCGNHRYDIRTPLHEIAASAQRRSRPYRCVGQQGSHCLELDVREQEVTQLLPWLGRIHFTVRSPSTPFAVPVPGLRCELNLDGGGPSQTLLPPSRHVDQCQAAHHAIVEHVECPPGELHAVLSAPSVREVLLLKSTDRLQHNTYPHVVHFRQRRVSLDDLCILAVACPNLSRLSVSLSNTTLSAASDSLPTFPFLTHLWLQGDNSSLASHIARTSPKLRTVALGCPQVTDALFQAMLALPSLTSLKIEPELDVNDCLDGDDDYSNNECTEVSAGTCSSVAGSAFGHSCVRPRLRHLHVQMNSAVAFPSLCVLLGDSSATLESLHLYLCSTSAFVRSVVAVLLTGRFARLRKARIIRGTWADHFYMDMALSGLRAHQPLCSWSH